MAEAFLFNIILIFVVVALAALLVADVGDRLFAAWFAFCLACGLSFFGWAIYIVAHFVSKYW